jgi:hypothetical protein
MIRECDIRRQGDAVLVGIALDCAVLDFRTTEAQLRDCLALLDQPHNGLVHMRIGAFGEYPVTLNIHQGDSVSLFVDGPHFEPLREMCAAIWLSNEDLRGIIEKALSAIRR